MKLTSYKYTIIIPLCIYIVFLAVIFTGFRPLGGDGRHELEQIKNSLEYGWNIDESAFTNVCIPLTVIAPFISRTFGVAPLDIYRGVFPFIFALTPTMLYFIFRRVMSPGKALLSALFFIVLPPTYQEVPGIAKTMIAEPLAAGVLLILLSKYRVKLRAGFGLILTFLVIMCHYTVGFFLLAWLGVSTLISRRKDLLVVVGIAGIVALGYLSIAGDGVIIKSLLIWGRLPDTQEGEALFKVIKGQEIETYADGQCIDTVALPEGIKITPWHLPFKVPSIWKTTVIYLGAIMLFLGGIYWITHDEYLKGHKELSAMIVFSGAVVVLAVWDPFFTRGLLISRWIQIGSIPMSGLCGISTCWLPRRWSYPIASMILIALLAVVR